MRVYFILLDWTIGLSFVCKKLRQYNLVHVVVGRRQYNESVGNIIRTHPYCCDPANAAS
jgi:hypothetical protein